MKFTKMEGLGNDYIYINKLAYGDIDYSYLATVLSDRHFGIGADGIITIGRSEVADFYMQIYNADGSLGEMCGNGIRCVGKYVYESGLTDKTDLVIETLAGLKYLHLNILGSEVKSVEVDMGIPTLHNGNELNLKDATTLINIDGNDFETINVSMGNPHAVIFVPEITDELVHVIGPKIENHKNYPNRTNVEFVKVLSDDEIQMRVWERGSGETLACGTGSCASVVAYTLKYGKELDKEIIVKLLGGDLSIKYGSDSHVYMDGPANRVYDGDFNAYKILHIDRKR